MSVLILESVSVPVWDDNLGQAYDENGVPLYETKEAPYGYKLRDDETCVETDYQTAMAMRRPHWLCEGRNRDGKARDNAYRINDGGLWPINYVWNAVGRVITEDEYFIITDFVFPDFSENTEKDRQK